MTDKPEMPEWVLREAAKRCDAFPYHPAIAHLRVSYTCNAFFAAQEASHD